MFSGTALSVIPVADDNPRDALTLVVSGSGRNSVIGTGCEVLDLVSLAVGSVDGTDQHVVRDIVQVSTVLQPWSSHRYVVGGGLSLGLDQDRHVQLILSIPRLKGLEELKTIARWRDGNRDARAVSRRGLIRILSRVVSPRGEALAGWGGKEKLVSVLVLELIGQGVEVEGARDRHCYHEIWGGDEGMGRWIGVVASCEISIIGRDDRVRLSLSDVIT